MIAKLPPTISSSNKQTLIKLEPGPQHPQLIRLQADFGFRIFSNHGYSMSTDNDPEQESVVVTPRFNSLKELERHVDCNMVDILYSYLFAIPADDYLETQQQA